MNRRDLLKLFATAPIIYGFNDSSHAIQKSPGCQAPANTKLVHTGFTSLDAMIKGLSPGQLTVVGGRPSMGKTAFAISLARNVALVQKCSVGYFSIEMAKEQLMSRVLAQESSVALSSVIDGNVGVEAWSGIVNSSAKLSDSRLAIDDSSFLCPFELQKKCEKLKNKNGLDLVVIDYLQLMRTEKRLSSRRHEIAEICHWLKVMARDLDVPVIALSQLNRPTERRRTRRPALNDLRETPAIGDLADTVLTLYREHYYDTFVPNSVLEVNVLKSSTGMVGAAELGWDAKCVRVGNRFT